MLRFLKFDSGVLEMIKFLEILFMMLNDENLVFFYIKDFGKCLYFKVVFYCFVDEVCVIFGMCFVLYFDLFILSS